MEVEDLGEEWYIKLMISGNNKKIKEKSQKTFKKLIVNPCSSVSYSLFQMLSNCSNAVNQRGFFRIIVAAHQSLLPATCKVECV